jgi:hypothetical protein
MGTGDLRQLRRQRSALTCRQTGTPRGSGACMAAWDRSCDYCNLPVPTVDVRLRLDALLDERAQYAAEDYR